MQKRIGKLLVSFVMFTLLVILGNVAEVKAGQGNYTVVFHGNGATSGNMKNQTMGIGVSTRINKITFSRNGYTFAGWSMDKKGTGDLFSNNQNVKNLSEVDGDKITLYAQWKVKEYNINYILNGGTNNSKNPKTYTINTSKIVLAAPSRNGYGFMGWYKDKSLKKQVTTISKGSKGNIKLYAKWAKLHSPTATSGKITGCKVTGKNKVKVTGKVSKLLKSSDDYYYVVKLEPGSTYINSRLARIKKDFNISYTFDTKEDAAVLFGRVALAVKVGGKYKIISNSACVKNPENVAENKNKYFVPATKKGIQFTTHDELKSTGAKNTFFNLPVSYIVSGSKDVPFKYNGKTYHFSNLNAYRLTFSELNKTQVSVTMQILLDWGNGACSNLIAGEARVAGKNYYTWNTRDKAARDEMEAIFAYLASIFGKENCYVSNWILGNEVNACDVWNYRGSMSDDRFVESYAFTYSQLYRAVKSNNKYAKVFTCIDHTWGIETDGMGGRDFINKFSKYVKKYYSGINWNLAYHAYPVPLYDADFWNNEFTSNDENTKYITMKNIDVLTKYIKKHYGSKTRIILSEQGFVAEKGQDIQAAAIALAYYKAACDPMIDAFIIRSYADAPSEVAMGLSMGIKGRKAFNVFKYMDTSKSLNYTNGLLGTIGVNSWSNVVPNFNKKYLTKVYRKE